MKFPTDIALTLPASAFLHFLPCIKNKCSYFGHVILHNGYIFIWVQYCIRDIFTLKGLSVCEADQVNFYQLRNYLLLFNKSKNACWHKTGFPDENLQNVETHGKRILCDSSQPSRFPPYAIIAGEMRAQSYKVNKCRVFDVLLSPRPWRGEMDY